MFAYIVRRILYAISILIGVNLITFALFFVVNTPDDMARMQLGSRRVTPEAVEKWKAERGYNLQLLWNEKAAGAENVLFARRDDSFPVAEQKVVDAKERDEKPAPEPAPPERR